MMLMMPALKYDEGLVEDLLAVSLGGLDSLLRALARPPERYYIRVNLLKTTPEAVMEAARSAGIELRRDEVLDYALWAPVKGPFRIDATSKVVVADKRAAESVYVGSDLYGPGVLKAEGVKKGDYVTVVTPDGIPVANGVAAMDWREMTKRPPGVAVKVTNSVYMAPKIRDIPGFDRGLFYSQSYPSMWVAELASPKRGQTIIDMNAAPGGKVSHVAQMTGPYARIIAFDRPSKVDKLVESLGRLGITWVEVHGADSREASRVLGRVEFADLVLIDPPCTNLGVIPKLSDSKTLNDAANLASYQFQFIVEAWRLLKPGGLLAYSTCTITDVENEFNVARAAELGFEPVRPDRVPPGARATDLGVRFDVERGFPGFFISLLRKPGAPK